MTWLAAAAVGLLAASATTLLLPGRPRWDAPPVPAPTGVRADDGGWMARHRGVLALLAGLGAWLFVAGAAGVVAGLVVTVVVWIVVGRAESPAARRERDALRRELPHVVTLLAAALRAGVAPAEAARLVCRALPGPATARLHRTVARLELGADPGEVWSHLAREPGLAPLGRALSRSHATGASVVTAVERLSDQLAREARGDVEDRARAVGVKAAVPLGLCLLPAFLLIGIVPLVAGLMTAFRW